MPPFLRLSEEGKPQCGLVHCSSCLLSELQNRGSSAPEFNQPVQHDKFWQTVWAELCDIVAMLQLQARVTPWNSLCRLRGQCIMLDGRDGCLGGGRRAAVGEGSLQGRVCVA